jgi:DNA-binding NarL/FixJ family response regulator
VSNTEKLSKYINNILIKEKVLTLDIKNEIFNLDISNNDILIVSIELFDDIGQTIEFLKSLPSSLKVIALKEKPNLAEGTYLVKKGVKSYFYSFMNEKTMNEVLQIVKNGNTWVYPQLMTYIIKQVSLATNKNNKNILKKLTPREQEVALLVASGNSNNEISQNLNVALVTVKKHISSIFEKLDIKDRVSLSIMINK